MLVDQDAAGPDDVFRFGIEQPDGPDVRLQACNAQAENITRGRRPETVTDYYIPVLFLKLQKSLTMHSGQLGFLALQV